MANGSDARKKKRARMRFIKQHWLWVLLAIIVYIAWVNPTFLKLLASGAGLLLRLVFAMFFIVVQFGGLFYFLSRSKTEVILPGDPKSVTFDDYKGQDKLLELVKQWLTLLDDRDKFKDMGGEFINGLLLYGPAGTGKSMLAKVMAAESGGAFVSTEGSSFRAMFVGIDVLKMISFINKGKKLAKLYGSCILYIDEIDAIGASRGAVMKNEAAPQSPGLLKMVMGGMGMGMGSMALTRLLYSMDSIEEKSKWERRKERIYQFLGIEIPEKDWHVLFVGSTNRPDVLDPALLRPGRMDRKIAVDPPTKAGRREIIKHYLSKIKYDDTVDVEALVQNTVGVTPATIMSAITKSAVRSAIFDNRTQVNHNDIVLAFQEQILGLETPIEEMEDDIREQIAIHEAGHAVAIYYLRPEKKIVHTSIVSRGRGNLGYVLPTPKYEEHAKPLTRIIADIKVSLAGHAAVKVLMGEPWTGAYSDFAKVRTNIRHLIQLGYFGPPLDRIQEIKLSAGKKEENEYAQFWREQEAETEQFIQERSVEVRAIANALLEHDSLTGEQVEEIIKSAT